MKKLILCSLITISVTFGVDCNAMINRYSNEPMKVFKSCNDNNNADACFCFFIALSALADELRQVGDYKKADKSEKYAIILIKKACQLGSREACAILDKAGAIK